MSRKEAEVNRARSRRSPLGSNPADVIELAFHELTGIADRACGCLELKDGRSGSWVSVKECQDHGRKTFPGPEVTAGKRPARIVLELTPIPTAAPIGSG